LLYSATKLETVDNIVPYCVSALIIYCDTERIVTITNILMSIAAHTQTLTLSNREHAHAT